MLRKLEILFDEQVRPALAAHGGNVEIVDIDNNQVFLRLQGGCQGCSSSNATLKMLSILLTMRLEKILTCSLVPFYTL